MTQDVQWLCRNHPLVVDVCGEHTTHPPSNTPAQDVAEAEPFFVHLNDILDGHRGLGCYIDGCLSHALVAYTSQG